MKPKLEHRLGVKAPAHVIWEILADIPAWPEWCPLYPEAKGVVGFGERLTLTEALPARARRTIRPVILDWAPDEAIHWRGSRLGGLVTTIRYLEIEKMHEAGCIFSNGEVYQGLVAGMFAKRAKRGVRAGFVALGEALRDRAEARWRERAGVTT
jgi:hypothetical protein